MPHVSGHPLIAQIQSVSWKHAHDKLAAPKLCVGGVAPLFLSLLQCAAQSLTASECLTSPTVFALCTPPAARSHCNYFCNQF